ncbi:MAG: hypothetical protein GWP64_03505 [Gammaproteobacteria bacterium]|jgi:hypothetical protein|nr:hypothetical protein [Gammaproteobacteria bacterium]NCF58899.1 hypothetical protein [Gammaproteobacteria bacterium]
MILSIELPLEAGELIGKSLDRARQADALVRWLEHTFPKGKRPRAAGLG